MDGRPGFSIARQAEILGKLDELEAAKRQAGEIQTSAQLQEFTKTIGRLEQELEALGQGRLSDRLGSEDLGRLAEAVKEEQAALTGRLKNDTIVKNNEQYLQRQLDFVWNGEKLFLPQGATLEDVKSIAGNGSDRPIRDVNRLVAQYGGHAEEWKKNIGNVISSRYIFDVHWYELDGIQYDIKLKYRKEK